MTDKDKATLQQLFDKAVRERAAEINDSLYEAMHDVLDELAQGFTEEVN